MNTNNYTERYPLTPAVKPNVETISSFQEDQSSRFLICYTFGLEFRGYELQNFIESQINSSVDNISLFSNSNGEKTGIVAVELSYPTPHSKLIKIMEKTFKNTRLQVRAFPSLSEFHKFMEVHSIERLNQIGFTTRKPPPLVYVQNFRGDAYELKVFFQTLCHVQLVRKQNAKNGIFIIVYFEDEASSLKACKTFHQYQQTNSDLPLIVRPLYKNAATEYLYVGISNEEDCHELCSNYGSIEEIKQSPTGNGCFIHMKNIESSKAACALIGGLSINDIPLRTFFITANKWNSI